MIVDVAPSARYGMGLGSTPNGLVYLFGGGYLAKDDGECFELSKDGAACA